MEEEESKVPPFQTKEQPSLNKDQALLSSPERKASIKNEYFSSERPQKREALGGYPADQMKSRTGTNAKNVVVSSEKDRF